MSYCTLASAILTKQSQNVQKNAREFGINLGIAFQLIDDTLDFSGESLKDSMLDLNNGVVNAVFYDYLEKNPTLFTRFKNGEDLSTLIDLNNLKSSVEAIVNTATKHLEMAHHNLSLIEIELQNSLDNTHIEAASEHLKMILAYLVLRKN